MAEFRYFYRTRLEPLNLKGLGTNNIYLSTKRELCPVNIFLFCVNKTVIG